MKILTKEEAIKIQAEANTDDSTIEGQVTHQPHINRSIDTVDKLKNYFVGKVVEIGCDFGHASIEIQKLGHKVVAMDLVNFRVEEAKKRGINAVLGAMEELPFKDKEFDTGLYSHVLEHSYDFKKAVSEAKRVFKRLIIIVPIKDPYGIPCHTSSIDDPEIIRKNFPGKIVLETKWNRLNWKNKEGKDTLEFIYVVDLEDLSGGWSSPNGKKEIKEWIEKQTDIKTIVDVGPGKGTYAKLLGNKYNWIGIEAWKPYVEKYNLSNLYKEIIISDIKDIREFPKAD
jgi:SAM-dependent methyltransferase